MRCHRLLLKLKVKKRTSSFRVVQAFPIRRSSADITGDKTRRANLVTAEKIGRMVAERSRSKNVGKVVFDRGGFLYHGKVKALADAARSGGLEF